MQLFFSAEYVAAGDAFDTTRKALDVVDSLTAVPVPGVELVVPTPVRRELLELVHDPDYINAVLSGQPRSRAESQGLRWDEGLAAGVLASTGGVVDVRFAALEDGSAGSLSSGLHHARADRGLGYCTLNGLAIGAVAALESLPVDSYVVVVDLDADCGGGTHTICGENRRIQQVDIAVHRYDFYQPGDNVTLDLVDDPDAYLDTVRQRLDELLERSGIPALCLYNAGMDPHENCSEGGRAGITTTVLAAREKFVFQWAAANRIPIAFVLAGGYAGDHLTCHELADLHRLTIDAAASTPRPRSPTTRRPPMTGTVRNFV